jgi:acid stress chaperone HdeB
MRPSLIMDVAVRADHWLSGNVKWPGRKSGGETIVKFVDAAVKLNAADLIAVHKLDKGIWSSPRKDDPMLVRRAAVVAVALALAAPAYAQTWDLSTVTCQKFLSYDKDTVNIVLAWVDAYYRGENDPPVIDLQKYLANAKKLGTYCGAHPDSGLITATDELFGKK